MAETNEIPNESTHARRDSTSSFTKNQSRPSIVKMYSLKSQTIIKEMLEFDKDEDTQVTCIKSNHKVIVLASHFIFVIIYPNQNKSIFMCIRTYNNLHFDDDNNNNRVVYHIHILPFIYFPSMISLQ
jgi:hypothetical protein